MLDDVFDDVSSGGGGSDTALSSHDVRAATSSTGDSSSTSLTSAGDDDHGGSVCSLEDSATTVTSSSSTSRPRCLSTSMPSAAGTAAGHQQSISVSTDRLWSCVLSLAASQQDGSGGGGAADGHVVRCSRSQENYIDMTDMICVDINIDDNMASSVEALHYRDVIVRRSTCSDGGVGGASAALAPAIADINAPDSQSVDEASPSNEATTDAKIDQRRQSATTADDVTSSRLQQTTVGNSIDDVIVSAQTSGVVSTSRISDAPSLMDSCRRGRHEQRPSVVVSGNPADDDDGGDDDDEEIVDSDESDDDDVDGAPTVSGGRVKDADRPSAARLAKRLYHLDGFRKADISPHLSKKNSFSQLVGEEFLKYFDFTGESLDKGLRRFLQQVTVTGDSQECDRLLGHFSRRFHQCNPTTHQSEDCCHTLVCAMMLLNSNLNIQNVSGRKMSLLEFISNLSEMNNGEDFPRDVLKTIYLSIKTVPLQFNTSNGHHSKSQNESIVGQTTDTGSKSVTPPQPTPLTAALMTSNNNVLTTSGASSELKKGYVMRKCCFEPEGRKTALGRRYWKMFYMTLRDLTLYFHNDERGFERGPHTTNKIRIEHALATKASDYTKKKHVFRLQTVDLAQYLIQTSDSRECQEWIDAINLVAACYSTSPVQSSHTTTTSTSRRRSFPRPTLTASTAKPVTSLTLKEQVERHHEMAVQLEQELTEFRRTTVDKPVHTKLLNDCCKTENYLRFELKRYRTYIRLLRVKLSAAMPQTETCLDDVTPTQRRTHKQSPSLTRVLTVTGVD